MDEWMDRLREGASDVRPASDARTRITEELGRRRRRRHGLTALGAVASVAVVVVAGAVVPRLLDGDGAAAPGDPANSSATSTTTSEVAPSDFTCPLENPIFTDQPPPIPDLARQQQIAEEVGRPPVGPDFHVNVARPTPFGVVALVTGDVRIARAALVPQGVSLVYRFDPSGADVGLDPDAQVDQVVQWQLEPVMRYAQHATQDVGGLAGFAYWNEAGAILVQWQEPVPDEVQSLVDIQLKSGGDIIVLGVTYSAADVRRAQRALDLWQAQRDMRWDLSMSTACGDFSGLVVGVTPGSLRPGDRNTLQILISEAIAMPAYVVPEERPIYTLPEH